MAEHRRAAREHARQVADEIVASSAGTNPLSVSSTITGTP